MIDPDTQDTYLRLQALRAQLPLTQWPASFFTALKTIARQLAADQVTPFFPPVVYIEPTNACNCTCIICPRRQMKRPIGYMDLNMFRQIVDDIARTGPSEVRLFNFGEPLLHPALPEMVRLCRERQLDARVQTNGLALNEARLGALLDAGLDYLGVSLNGLSAAEYEMIRPGFKFEQAQALLRQARATAIAKGKPLHLHLNIQMLRTEAASRDQEIKAFVQSWNEVADSLSISGLELQEGISYLRQGCLETCHLADLPRKPDSAVTCTEPFDRLVIKWDGRATACCADMDAAAVVGLLPAESIDAVWHSPALQRIRERLKAHDFKSLPVCQTCCRFYSEGFTQLFKKHKECA